MNNQYTKENLLSDVTSAAARLTPPVLVQFDESSDLYQLRSEQGESLGGFRRSTLFQQLSELSNSDRANHLDALLNHVLTADSMEEADFLASLLLRVRTPAQLAQRALHATLSIDGPPSSVIFPAGPLQLELVSDSQLTVGGVTDDQLIEYSVSADEALRISVAALTRQTDRSTWLSLKPDVWLSGYQDDYDFTRLVALTESLSWPFKKSIPIVFAPSHSVCLVTNTNTPAILESMLNTGYAMSETHRPFCHRLWTFDDNGQCHEFTPDNDSPLFSLARRQALYEDYADYDDQKTLLDEKNKANNIDEAVSSFSMIERDGIPASLCVFVPESSKTARTLLPVTDFVACADLTSNNDEQPALTDWDSMVSRLGNRITVEEGLTPTRYAVTAEPGSTLKE